MGLDITAYRNLQPADPEQAFDENGDMVWDGNYTQVYVNDNFLGRHEPLQDRMAYTHEDSFSFRAGSYSGYNAWRNELAVLAGFKSDRDAWDATEGPFWELICFSDCEGTIGSIVSKKLAQDFADYQEKADLVDDEWFKSKYAEWRAAFEMAADNGAVDFH